MTTKITVNIVNSIGINAALVNNPAMTIKLQMTSANAAKPREIAGPKP
ncbi:MAG: hypothetical protein RIF39_04655 [Cyclobacteriaceae bacterium]